MYQIRIERDPALFNIRNVQEPPRRMAARWLVKHYWDRTPYEPMVKICTACELEHRPDIAGVSGCDDCPDLENCRAIFDRKCPHMKSARAEMELFFIIRRVIEKRLLT